MQIKLTTWSITITTVSLVNTLMINSLYKTITLNVLILHNEYF